MKLKVNEVIENVKDELLCYEEGEKLVARWEKEFKEWVEKNKGKKKDIVVDKGGVSLKIKDEEERKKKKDQEKAQIWMLADLWCQTSIAGC